MTAASNLRIVVDLDGIHFAAPDRQEGQPILVEGGGARRVVLQVGLRLPGVGADQDFDRIRQRGPILDRRDPGAGEARRLDLVEGLVEPLLGLFVGSGRRRDRCEPDQGGDRRQAEEPARVELDHGLAAPIFDLGLDLEGRRLGILVGHVAKLTRYEQLGGARHVHAPFRELVEQGLGDGGAAGRCLAGGISLGDEVAHLDHVSPVLDHPLDLLGQLRHFLVEVAGGASRQGEDSGDE